MSWVSEAGSNGPPSSGTQQLDPIVGELGENRLHLAGVAEGALGLAHNNARPATTGCANCPRRADASVRIDHGSDREVSLSWTTMTISARPAIKVRCSFELPTQALVGVLLVGSGGSGIGQQLGEWFRRAHAARSISGM